MSLLLFYVYSFFIIKNNKILNKKIVLKKVINISFYQEAILFTRGIAMIFVSSFCFKDLLTIVNADLF